MKSSHVGYSKAVVVDFDVLLDEGVDNVDGEGVDDVDCEGVADVDVEGVDDVDCEGVADVDGEGMDNGDGVCIAIRLLFFPIKSILFTGACGTSFTLLGITQYAFFV